MTSRLNQSVLAGGVVYPAGQAATDELRAKIRAEFWDGAEAAGDEGTTAYSSQSKADLEAEVDRRNEGRDEDAAIVVGGKGNKPDLVAALEADDAVQG